MSRRHENAISLAAGAFTSLLGAAVLVAWHVAIPAMLYVHPGYTPMAYNTAVSFLLLGLGVLATGFHRPGIAQAAAVVVGAIAATGLLQFATGVPHGFEVVFSRFTLPAPPIAPVQMAPNTGIGILSGAIAVWLRNAKRGSPVRATGIAFLGSAAAVLGLDALLGYSTGLPTYLWGSLRPMALNTAAGLLVLGISLVAASWTEVQRGPRYWPLAVSLIPGLVICISVWRALTATESGYVEAAMRGRSGLPEVVFVLGLLVVLLLTMLLFVAQTARRSAEIAEGLQGDAERASQALAAERQRISEILDALPAYVILLDRDYHASFANRFFRERFGESHGQRCFEYLFGRTEPCEVCETYKVLETGEPQRWEWLGPDGRNYDIYDFPFTDADGTNLILEMGLDITERKQTEGRLRQQAALLDLAYDAILVRDLDSRIVSWNDGAVQAYGWRAAEALGRSSHELLNTEFPIPLADIEARVWDSGRWEGELTQRTREGTTIIVESRWSLQKDGSGGPRVILEINRDITERKEAEKELRRIEWMVTRTPSLNADSSGGNPADELFPAYGDITALNTSRLILDSVGSATLADVAGSFLSLLDTSAAIYEKNGDYAFGIFRSGWCRLLDRASRARCEVAEDQQALACGKWICHESCWNTAAHPAIESGRPVDVDCAGGIRLYAVPIRAGAEIIGGISFGYGDPPEDPGRLREIAVKYGVGEHDLRAAAAAYESRPEFIIELAKNRLEAAAGLIGEMVQRKRTEEALQEKAEDLARSNADLEQFAYVASHDLQEPLRMVANFTQLLAERYRDKLDADGVEFIGYAVDGARRMQRLIQDLLMYSRVGTRGKGFERIHCNEILGLALANLHLSIQDSGAVVTHDDLPVVKADPFQLLQVFQNLIGNAIKFRSEESPRIHVGATRQAQRWVFAVRDNGIGIDPEFSNQIFVIFQRLHSRDQYPGTGIGLALCKKIVERHGGRIWVESHPGKGATFYFTIPAA